MTQGFTIVNLHKGTVPTLGNDDVQNMSELSCMSMSLDIRGLLIIQ